MYQDPSRIRSHVVKLRFSEEESRLIDALTDYTGDQKAVLLRELILEQAAAVLGIQSGAQPQAVEVPSWPPVGVASGTR